MGTISVSLPADGSTADVSDYNTPINTIVSELNGGLDNDNIATGAAIDGSKLANTSVTATQIAADAVTATKIDWASTGADAGIWWEELGRTTLSGAGDTIDVQNLAARKYLRIQILTIATGGTTTMGITFNNDTAGNYARQTNVNFGGVGDATSASALDIAGGASAENKMATVDFINVLAQEKIGQAFVSESGGAGAANAPDSVYNVLKWANTAAQITRVTVTNAGTGDYAIGSEVVVLGHN